MANSEIYWVLPLRVRNLIHEGLDRKYVRVGAQTPQCGHAKRHIPYQVFRDALIGKRIQRHRIAIAATAGLWDIADRWQRQWLRNLLCGEQVARALRSTGSDRVRAAQDVVLPINDMSLFVQPGADCCVHRGTVGLPQELVGT